VRHVAEDAIADAARNTSVPAPAGATGPSAADVRRIVVNAPDVASRLDADEKSSIVMNDRRGIPHPTAIVNRPGLTKVLRDSRKPEAKAAADRFGRWTMTERGSEFAHPWQPSAAAPHQRGQQPRGGLQQTLGPFVLGEPSDVGFCQKREHRKSIN
jgi:hypothetical protein